MSFQRRNPMRVSLVLLKLILAALALGLEIQALRLILSESMSDQNLVTAALCHLIASAVAAYIFPKILAPDHHATELRNNIFFLRGSLQHRRPAQTGHRKGVEENLHHLPFLRSESRARDGSCISVLSFRWVHERFR